MFRSVLKDAKRIIRHFFAFQMNTVLTHPKTGFIFIFRHPTVCWNVFICLCLLTCKFLQSQKFCKVGWAILLSGRFKNKTPKSRMSHPTFSDISDFDSLDLLFLVLRCCPHRRRETGRWNASPPCRVGCSILFSVIFLKVECAILLSAILLVLCWKPHQSSTTGRWNASQACRVGCSILLSAIFLKVEWAILLSVILLVPRCIPHRSSTTSDITESKTSHPTFSDITESRMSHPTCRGRRQNLNPEPRINLNHANLKPPNLWAVVSQEFARFTQEFHSNPRRSLK